MRLAESQPWASAVPRMCVTAPSTSPLRGSKGATLHPESLRPGRAAPASPFPPQTEGSSHGVHFLKFRGQSPKPRCQQVAPSAGSEGRSHNAPLLPSGVPAPPGRAVACGLVFTGLQPLCLFLKRSGPSFSYKDSNWVRAHPVLRPPLRSSNCICKGPTANKATF